MITSQTREFVSLATSTKILGVTAVQVKNFAEQRLVGTQQLPGMPTRYRMADLVALAEKCTVSASSASVVVV